MPLKNVASWTHTRPGCDTEMRNIDKAIKQKCKIMNESSINACSNLGAKVITIATDCEVHSIVSQLCWNWSGYTRDMEDP